MTADLTNLNKSVGFKSKVWTELHSEILKIDFLIQGHADFNKEGCYAAESLDTLKIWKQRYVNAADRNYRSQPLGSQLKNML